MIDSHQHFWQYSAKEYGWISETMPALRRDFLPADLLQEQKNLGFRGSIAVQARQSLAETEWLLKLADAEARILGVVGWVDLCSPKLSDQLDIFIHNPKFKGVRHVVQDEPDDRIMLKPDFLRGLSLLEFANLSYDLLVYPRQLPSAIEVARRFPRLRLVLDHIAKPPIKTGELLPWSGQIAELAGYPNVFCKVSGMVTEADWKSWKPGDFDRYLDCVTRAFGPERLMFGSDWPVCTLAGSYGQVYEIARNFYKGFSAGENKAIFELNAARFYQC
jgi:L-fuconolactonase